jgi:hypothetical protein
MKDDCRSIDALLMEHQCSASRDQLVADVALKDILIEPSKMIPTFSSIQR